MGKSKDIRALFENSFNELSAEEKTEHKAGLLAMQFLGLVDAEMEAQKISKKELARKVGTSASFITQLFMGDRKPSWTMLAKMQDALGLQFEITTSQELEAMIEDEIMDYHRKWEKSVRYRATRNQEDLKHAVMFIEELETKDFALAG